MFTEEQAERLVVAFERIADSLLVSTVRGPHVGIADAIDYLGDRVGEIRPDTEVLAAEIANVAQKIDGIPSALEDMAQAIVNLPERLRIEGS